MLKATLTDKRSLWILLGLLAILLANVLPAGVVERYYSRGLFPVIRWGFTVLNSWLPFASVYVLFVVLLGWAIASLVRFFKNKTPWPRRLGGALFSLLAFAGGVLFFFQVLWGFNYGRLPLESRLNISPTPLAVNELRSEMEIAADEALRLRAMLPGAGDGPLPVSLLPDDIEKIMREKLADCLHRFQYPVPGTVRGRMLWPKGILLRISTAGVYIPFTGEGNVDAGLHFLQLPFVLAHEMSHGYGFGDEGTCNFLAYLACTLSDDPFLNYVGHLYYWRYVAGDYRALQPEAYKAFFEELPPGFKADLVAIRDEMDKYPDIFPAARDAVYHAYLQAQGIQEGLKNYDRVIMLVRAWRQSEESRE